MRSRWTIPRSCAYASADAIGRATSAASSQVNVRPRASSAEACSLHELHDEERRLTVLAVVVEAHDVLVLERGEHTRLTGETAAQLDILGDPGVQQLDRHVAPQPPSDARQTVPIPPG